MVIMLQIPFGKKSHLTIRHLKARVTRAESLVIVEILYILTLALPVVDSTGYVEGSVRRVKGKMIVLCEE